MFALGRALLSKDRGKVLILDEATSNVDVETDKLMQEVITDEFKGYRVLCVSHRLTTIMDADMVLVVDAGRVVDFDRPRALLERKAI